MNHISEIRRFKPKLILKNYLRSYGTNRTYENPYPVSMGEKLSTTKVIDSRKGARLRLISIQLQMDVSGNAKKIDTYIKHRPINIFILT